MIRIRQVSAVQNFCCEGNGSDEPSSVLCCTTLIYANVLRFTVAAVAKSR